MLAVAILAAGKGTRIKSDLPKVLQKLAGKSLIERVIKNCNGLSPEKNIVIVGHQANLVEEHLVHINGLEFIRQVPQNGTGHAVQQLIPYLQDFDGDLLVLNGDVPLLKSSTIEELVRQHRSFKAGVTLLSSRVSNPKGYGRVFADQNNNVREIIEDRDCNKEELTNNLINAGIYCFNWRQLKEILPSLSSENEQGEIYITDTIEKISVAMHLEITNSDEITGVNDRSDLSYCEDLIQKELRKYWMLNGVTFTDAQSCTLSEECRFEQDVIVEPQTHFRGNCVVGKHCRLGPGTLIQNSELGDNVVVLQSVLTSARVENNSKIGPFSHIRPDTTIGTDCKIGNFVEIKKSVLGESTKVNHLSYIGDSFLGSKVNIGAGTITANYDGTQKHRTIIGDNSKTGANSVLVAPIHIGSSVTVGAGSTLTKDVPSFSLALGRAKQFIKTNWKNSRKSKD